MPDRVLAFVVKAETVVAWHRKGFRVFWRWKIGRGKPGRPAWLDQHGMRAVLLREHYQ
jgi:hypothetical protein